MYRIKVTNDVDSDKSAVAFERGMPDTRRGDECMREENLELREQLYCVSLVGI